MHANLLTRGLAASMVMLTLGGCASRAVKTDQPPRSADVAPSTTTAKPAAQATAPAPTRKASVHPRASKQVFRRGAMVDGDEMVIHTLPVGAGNCQLLQCPSQNKLIVFDCGSTGRGSLGWDADEVTEYVDGLIDGATQIVVSISHSDRDHSSYLPTVFADTQVDDILFAQVQGDYLPNVSDWMDEQEEGGANLIWWHGEHSDIAPNDELSCWAQDRHGGWDIDVAAYILAVNAGNTSNDASMVVSETYDTFQTIFTGDMTGETEDVINENLQIDLGETDVLTGAHHGADTFDSNSQEWADANEADLVMFSAGTSHLHPRCDAVDRYRPYVLTTADDHDYDCGQGGFYINRNTDEAILVTDTQGLITVTTDGQTFEYAWNPDATPNVGNAVEGSRPRRVTKSAVDSH